MITTMTKNKQFGRRRATVQQRGNGKSREISPVIDMKLHEYIPNLIRINIFLDPRESLHFTLYLRNRSVQCPAGPCATPPAWPRPWPAQPAPAAGSRTPSPGRTPRTLGTRENI